MLLGQRDPTPRPALPDAVRLDGKRDAKKAAEIGHGVPQCRRIRLTTLQFENPRPNPDGRR